MAKKKTTGPATPTEQSAAGPLRASTTGRRKRAALQPDPGVAEPGATPIGEPIDTAADMSAGAGSSDSPAAREPSYEEIAEAAYQRYLQRGGYDGQDFDDWLYAEQSLRLRR
jgi:hypothetical protein